MKLPHYLTLITSGSSRQKHMFMTPISITEFTQSPLITPLITGTIKGCAKGTDKQGKQLFILLPVFAPSP